MIGKICGTGSYLPDYIIDNFKLAESVDTSDEWIQERTGIRQRHIAKKETTSYMASMAALKALENAGTEPEEIDMILVATSSSETVSILRTLIIAGLLPMPKNPELPSLTT